MVIVFMIITFFIYCLFGLIPSDPAATGVEPLRDQVDAKTFEELYRAERARQGLTILCLYVIFAGWDYILTWADSGSTGAPGQPGRIYDQQTPCYRCNQTTNEEYHHT